MKREFPFVVKPVNKEEYGVKYVVEYVDFPGITGGGDTPEEAIKIATEGFNMFVDVLEEEGKSIQTFTHINYTGRVTLRVPKTMHMRITEMAEREGVSLNTYILDAISQKLYSTNISGIVDNPKTKFRNHGVKNTNLSWVTHVTSDKSSIVELKYSNFTKKLNGQEKDNYAFSI